MTKILDRRVANGFPLVSYSLSRVRYLNMYNIETSKMSLSVLDDSNSSDVVSSNDIACIAYSQFKLLPESNLM